MDNLLLGKRDSHPPKPDRYLIYRIKCRKMHFEHWNRSGWSSSNNEALKWAYINNSK